MPFHQQTQRLGDHHRVQQDLANGAYSYVAGNYTVKHGAREIILGKALRRSIADAYAAFVAQVDGLPKDAYGKALHALEYAYPADFNATGMHDLNMSASVFVTSRSKHAAICNTAKQILYNLDEHQHKVFKMCPPPLRDLAKRAPVREETHLSYTYSPTRQLQPTDAVDATASARRTVRSSAPSSAVSPVRDRQRPLITRMASFDPGKAGNHSSGQSVQMTGALDKRLDSKRKGLLSGKDKTSGKPVITDAKHGSIAANAHGGIQTSPAHNARPASANAYSTVDLRSSANSQDLTVQSISQEAVSKSQQRNHQRQNKPGVQSHLNAKAIGDGAATSSSGTGGMGTAAALVAPHLRVAEYYKKESAHTLSPTNTKTQSTLTGRERVEQAHHTVHSIQPGNTSSIAKQDVNGQQYITAASCRSSPAVSMHQHHVEGYGDGDNARQQQHLEYHNMYASNSGTTTRRYHTDNGAYNHDGHYNSTQLLPGQSVAAALGYTVTDARLLQLIHMHQAAQQQQFEKLAETDQRNAAMYAQQAAARGICSPGRSRRIQPQGRGCMLTRELSMPLVSVA